MAYTALKQMQQKNQALFGKNAGPKQPDRHYDTIDCGLKAMALRFLHARCEELRFADPETLDEETGYLGVSMRKGDIPYNMQMDINRLCLERELEKFIHSGVAEDAYTVYYCYLEMFFGHYGKSKKMVELLSEFESNGSSLLMKHRDHYSHSVYVFALGLAVYESNPVFRAKFKQFYDMDPDDANKAEDRKAAACFLEYWGLASLFHDIGYPFELPFEQVLSYYEVGGKDRDEGGLFLAYRNVELITKLEKEAQTHFETEFGRPFATTEELFAWGITDRLGKAYGFTEEFMLKTIHDKPIAPEGFQYHMDHAYFSATRLYREIEKYVGIGNIKQKHLDALTAILMHNSLFKFHIARYKDDDRKSPLRIDQHPLAWLLMLCDELQCWDRTAYGRNSRTELHPMAADFVFKNNAINAVYYYDQEEQEKIDEFKVRYREWEDGGEKGEAPRLKDYSDMAEKEQRFVSDILKIVNLSDVPLTVIPNTRAADRKNKHTYLSSSNFLHLYDFAVALNARYSHPGQEKKTNTAELEKEFEDLSLEYQLSNINQAKSFARYLDMIGCFYTDRPVAYRMIPRFSARQIAVFSPLEHGRWIREHISMAWQYGLLYETAEIPEEMIRQYGSEENARKALREQLRTHKLMMDGNPREKDIHAHYITLTKKDRKKDYEPFNSMLLLIKQYDGLRIYSLN